MALAAGATPQRRGAPSISGIYGGLVAAGEQVWRGGMICWNAAGTLQRLQTSGSVAFAGMASKDYNNTAGSVAACSPPMEALKGVYGLTVPNAGYANIRQPVYATDDNTFTLTNALTATHALGSGDTGTGTFGTITVGATAKSGVYNGTILSGATTFSLTDPTGAAMPNGTLGSAYSQNGVGFTLSNSGTNFIAGDTFTITVEDSSGAMQIGTLDGIENGQTYVKLLGELTPPMEITFPNLQSINDGVSLAYNDQLYAVGTRYRDFTFEASSTGAAEVYPRLNMLPGLREWVGDRVVQSLSQVTFSIANRMFEETIGVARTDIEDDKYGMLTPIAGELGMNAGRLPDILIAALLKAGHTTICYDGQNFFDTAHPDYTSAGAGTTSLNYVAGSSPVWFLFDVSRTLKPVIYQRRRPYTIIPKFSMTDPQVFWNKEFEWGVDGRSNCGYGIWQLGYMSQAALTVENLLAARATMATYRRPDGSPMGIRGTLLVTGSSNYPIAKALAEDEMIPNTYSTTFVGGTTVGLYPNPARGMFKALEDEWLN